MSKVKIYSTRTCPYCHMLKEYLTSNNIPFEDVYIDTDAEQAKKAFDTCGSMGVPCTHITKDDGTEEIILGFNKPKIDQTLGLT